MQAYRIDNHGQDHNIMVSHDHCVLSDTEHCMSHTVLLVRCTVFESGDDTD